MFSFSYFGSTTFLESKVYTAFWKCDEKIKVSPSFYLKEIMQRFAKLHVVYMKFLQ